MGHKGRNPNNPYPGKKKIVIDWEKVGYLLEAGCTADEIAGYLGVHIDTIYKRCVLDNNTEFSNFRATKKAKGESLLRTKQFEKAMKGNTTMLIWLGKIRLEQRETDSKNVPPNDGKITEMLSGMNEYLKSKKIVAE